ncbi:adenylyl-sulfate kinase [Buchnera aphidicola (Hyadaphis tataricae)]|uniref:Adenylyl-sulfate kinase n=1 Tax=Buchnera aphidicola (Hyadaphis tataricae) TaxID=1241859 RepID=A0A4D6Y714_9GAMM|nr:adenylyl-sulfate kinase [Buchnera aphidicola]QCI21710.1 adenylyl-sulfate kinase [Buchnera aphidicola (Hyadaphis tataricae)]
MHDNFRNNIIWQKNTITRIKRENKNGHKSILVWLTGLSGSGKSSIANVVEAMLFKHGVNTYLLDGDNIRLGLCSDLSFSLVDRQENIRRLGEVSKIMLDSGILVLASVISPYKCHRQLIFDIVGKNNCFEVFVDTPISICRKRDSKGLYKKADSGEIRDFTGVQSIYETPEAPDLILDGTLPLKKNAEKIIKKLYNKNIIPKFKSME